MQVKPSTVGAGVYAVFTHICGHFSPSMYYADESFAESDSPHQESGICQQCRHAIERQENACAKEELQRVHPVLRQFPVDPNPELPQPGDYYAHPEKAMVRVEADPIGQYWLRRVPDNGIVYQTWIRDQPNVADFLQRRGFVRVHKH
jgi:hypothetical protein